MNGTYRTLVPAPEVARHLDDPGWVVVDCRFTLADPARGESHYGLSRIPGARYAHLDRDLSSPPTSRSGRHPLLEPASFAATLGAWGIGPATQVVVYDDSFGSIAARLWWLLRWAGHGAVALLDGGWPAWKRHRLPLEEGTPEPAATAPHYPVRPDSDAVVDADSVDLIRCAPGWRLLDARPEERFTGEREPIDPIPGHVPGAVNRPYEDNLHFDGCFLSPEALRESFLVSLGGIPPARIVHTCGSGVTACHNLLAMEHAGLSGSRLYADSWSGWIADPRRPVAVGPA